MCPSLSQTTSRRAGCRRGKQDGERAGEGLRVDVGSPEPVPDVGRPSALSAVVNTGTARCASPFPTLPCCAPAQVAYGMNDPQVVGIIGAALRPRQDVVNVDFAPVFRVRDSPHRTTRR